MVEQVPAGLGCTSTAGSAHLGERAGLPREAPPEAPHHRALLRRERPAPTSENPCSDPPGWTRYPTRHALKKSRGPDKAWEELHRQVKVYMLEKHLQSNGNEI